MDLEAVTHWFLGPTTTSQDGTTGPWGLEDGIPYATVAMIYAPPMWKKISAPQMCAADMVTGQGGGKARTTVWQPVVRAVTQVMTRRVWRFIWFECVGDEK